MVIFYTITDFTPILNTRDLRSREAGRNGPHGFRNCSRILIMLSMLLGRIMSDKRIRAWV